MDRESEATLQLRHASPNKPALRAAESSKRRRHLPLLLGRRGQGRGDLFRSFRQVHGKDEVAFGLEHQSNFDFCRSAVVAVAVAVFSSGCVSKAKANAQARAAFLAGQQQALQQMQARGPSVTFVGEVKNTLVPWTAGLTLAKALLAADYYGPTDPKGIVIRRDAEEIQVNPNQLLSGEDIPLQPRDIIEITR